MKCPGCQYMCSDLRDLCPKCLSDLRAYKRAIGLAITNPDFTYQQLLQKHAQKTTPIKAHGPQGGLSGISQLFRSLWSDTERPTESRISEARESGVTAHVNPSPIAEQPARALRSEPAAQKAEPAGLQVLFRQAHEELLARSAQLGSSVYLEQIAQPPNKEQVELFFGLCADALRDPGTEIIYQEHITTSESRQVMSEALNQQLSKVEKVLSSSVFSLKSRSLPGLAAQSYGASKSAAQEARLQLQTAPLSLRLRSFFLDTLLVIFLGALCGLTYFTLNELALFQASERLEFNVLLAPSFLALLFCVAAATFYPLLAFSFFGTTFGLGVCGLRVLNKDQAELGRENAWLRSLIFPLSMALFGWLPLLFGRMSLHDRLAKTQVYLDPEEN